MFRLIFILSLVFAFPILMVAIAFSSYWMAMIGIVVGIAFTADFRVRSRGIFFRHLGAKPLPPDHVFYSTVERIFNAKSPEKMLHSFYQTAESDPVFHIWVRNPQHVDLIFSSGFIQRMNEDRLKRIFENAPDYAQIRVQNCLYALSLWWDRWKGSIEYFRYWFVSFWLYPLERILRLEHIQKTDKI